MNRPDKMLPSSGKIGSRTILTPTPIPTSYNVRPPDFALLFNYLTLKYVLHTLYGVMSYYARIRVNNLALTRTAVRNITDGRWNASYPRPNGSELKMHKG
ncbi:hypothetical protein J6590_073368 [Homalodisca vitripennis]|nr:hypothetical protein J6590_073368 [Homalodisca vitripennis]